MSLCRRVDWCTMLAKCTSKVPSTSCWCVRLDEGQASMATTTRKKRKHPGVTIEKPDPKRRVGWRARYIDPDSDRMVKVSLDGSPLRGGLGLTNAEQRNDWAVRKSEELTRRRIELRHGASPLVSSSLVEAINGFFAGAEHRLGVRTLELYRAASKLFLAWAERDGVQTTDMLKPTRLPAFRDFLLAQRRQGYVRGGKRGARTEGQGKLSPLTVNWQLRAVKTMLNDLRLRGVVPLTKDAIADCLKLVEAPSEAPEFLRPTDCRRALEAALRHDAETFAETREEHAGRKPIGTTARYDPIAPFTAFVLLCGLRLSEALAVRWAHVDLDARDADGNVVGELRLPAEITKTKRARTVGLDVSPSIKSLLAALKLRSGRVHPEHFVFGGSEPTPETLVESARRRLVGKYGAPGDFGWQVLRSTCATYQCNAPSLFGAAAAFMSAKRLGHSVAVSEKHYAGQFNGISRDARTLEQAMQIEDVMVRVVAAAAGGDVTREGVSALAVVR